jgi:hypothetical protein
MVDHPKEGIISVLDEQFVPPMGKIKKKKGKKLGETKKKST